MLLLFQLKIIISDLDWGRKINFCSFSSVNLNMEHVTFSYTFHLLDTHLPLPYPTSNPGQKMKGRKKKKVREGGKKGRRRENPQENLLSASQ